MFLTPRETAVVQPLRFQPGAKIADIQKKNKPKTKPPFLEKQNSDNSPSQFTQLIKTDEHSDESIPQNVEGTYDPEPERWKKLYTPKQAFYIAKLSPLCTIPKETMKWCRNASDERAAAEGYRFSEQMGQDVVWWIEDHCILYEGSKANTALICDDWQYEYFMQLFGWQYNSPELGKWIRRFTHAGVWIAKKNAKSPTLAATGLYALVGDGEPGQKCYCVAKDGKQAKIAHTHAVEMVKNSPVLMSECKINHTEGIIRHIPSKSIYAVVHAENSLSTEGFNGSLFCDETHVLSQKHMNRLKRAGISREEPLHVEVSTSGNNADDYGYNRYEYGKFVSSLGQRGELVPDEDNPEEARAEAYNPHFLFMDFSIDQKVTTDKLRDEKFIDSVAYQCNPALGRILRFEEFKGDWRDSLQSETELRQFAMYRLNLWLKDSAAWLELADWIRCADSPISQKVKERNESLKENKRKTKSQRQDQHQDERKSLHPKDQYTLEDLREYPCIGGLDLSKTKDMTAFSLIFAVPDDEIGVRPYTWTWHWLPRPTAQRYSRFINFEGAEFKPWLQLVNQKTVDYETVMRRMEWCRENFDLRAVGYDSWNATDLCRNLVNEYGWGEDMLVKVPQNMKFMAPVTKEFERYVIRQEIHHPNNSLLSWQFQHVSLDFDKLGNYRPIKPETSDDYRKIDGVISLLIAMAVLCSDQTIWTPSTGSILLFDRTPSDRGQTERLTMRNEDTFRETNSLYA